MMMMMMLRVKEVKFEDWTGSSGWWMRCSMPPMPPILEQFRLVDYGGTLLGGLREEADWEGAFGQQRA